MSLHAIILAAGRGTRMNSARPKVLHTVGGRPMLDHVLGLAQGSSARCHLVLGHGTEAVEQWLRSRPGEMPKIVQQLQQLGTAHAVQQALPGIPDNARVVVLYGDVPLMPPQTLAALIDAATAGLAIVTVKLAQPKGYGRILRSMGRVFGIVEENDATPQQQQINEVNTGLIAAPAGALKRWIAQVRNDNAKGEYYLTDIVALAVAEGIEVKTVEALDAEAVEGVNDRVQLARAERLFQRRQAEKLMRAGVQFADPTRFDLRGTLNAGRDVFIDVGVVMEGEVTLGDGVSVGPYSVLKNVTLGAGTQVLSHSVLEGLHAGAQCRIGPFSRVRPDSHFEDDVHIGNFVEVKKGALGRGTKAGHLAYLGDARVGADVNVSAGVITCNYDGANKHETVIGDGAFIGTDSQLVAPVTVGEGAFIAAGSTITQTVPPNQLTVCRARGQKTVPGWKRPVKKKS
jgi:bifunctional UDP-N-acetylglucosamine pyrophosphorylase/glucosamine-1-phosphate N-acetyltransferase